MSDLHKSFHQILTNSLETGAISAGKYIELIQVYEKNGAELAMRELLSELQNGADEKTSIEMILFSMFVGMCFILMFMIWVLCR